MKLLKQIEQSERHHAKAAKNMMQAGFEAGAIYKDKKLGDKEKESSSGKLASAASESQACGATTHGIAGAKTTLRGEETYTDSDDSSVYSEDENDHGTLVAHFGTVGPSSNCKYCMKACGERLKANVSDFSHLLIEWVKSWLPYRADKRVELREKMLAAEKSRKKNE